MVPVGGDHFTMMNAPNVALLAAALSDALGGPVPARIGHDEHDYDPLITLQTGRPGQRPLFCVPGAGASVTAFTGLVQEFDPAVPVYGLQPRGFCGQLAPHVDVESAARAYIRALRTVDPAGPYRLLGHSFGGWVAHEMALQLRAQGSTVELLVVLDSQSPFERAAAWPAGTGSTC
ncbi:alpha/beta fold hydrolase [Massilia sp. B-10]|nr:alpha/beta fold hydrolase [Massilia sp. B-10]